MSGDIFLCRTIMYSQRYWRDLHYMFVFKRRLNFGFLVFMNPNEFLQIILGRKRFVPDKAKKMPLLPCERSSVFTLHVLEHILVSKFENIFYKYKNKKARKLLLCRIYNFEREVNILDFYVIVRSFFNTHTMQNETHTIQ